MRERGRGGREGGWGEAIGYVLELAKYNVCPFHCGVLISGCIH